MPIRSISARFTADTAEYTAAVTQLAQTTRSFAEQAAAAGQVADRGMKEATTSTASYTEAVRVASRTEAEAAQANVAAAVKRRESLEALRAEYVKLAATAEEGSAQQITALHLQEVATKRLGLAKAAAADETAAANSTGLLTQRLEGLAGQNTIAARGLNEVSRASTGARFSLSEMSGATKLAGAGFLAFGFLLEQGVQKLMGLADATRTTQRITGASAEDASRFNGELKMVGINAEAAVPSLFRMTRNIQDHAEKFDAAGVSIQHYGDGSVNVLGTLSNLRERLLATSDSGERASVMFSLLGKGAVSLGPYLATSTEQLKIFDGQLDATGQIIGQKTVDQSLQLTRSMRLLGAEFQSVELNLAQGLLPQVVKGAALFAEFTGLIFNTGAALKAHEEAQEKAGAAANKHKGFLTQLNDDGYKLLDWTNRSGEFLGRHLGLLGSGGDKAAEATAKLAKAQDELKSKELEPYLRKLAESEDTSALSSDGLTKAGDKLQAKFVELAAPIGLSGDALLKWSGNATEIEAKAKAVSVAMDAASKAFSGAFSFTSTFSASSLTKEADEAAKSTDSLDKARQGLSDTEAKLAGKVKLSTSEEISLRNAQEAVAKAQKGINDETTVSNRLAEKFPERTRETQTWAEAVKQANDPIHKATGALQELLTKAGDLDPVQKKIVNFYQDSLIEGVAFRDNIRTAIKQGYDPGLISDLLQKGPKEAGPVLQELIKNHTGNLSAYVNSAQQGLNELNAQVVESSRLTNIAVQSSDRERAAELQTAQAIDQQIMVGGTTQTVQEVAKVLGVSVEVVRKTSKDYGLGLAEGVNPVLSGVGAPTITYDQKIDALLTPGGTFQPHFAEGGYLPRDARLQQPGTLVQWAEPETQGEYFIPRAPDRRDRSVALLSQAADDFGYTMLRKFATGGFILPGDVPQPPDVSGHGNVVGYTADKTDSHLYDLVAAFVAAHPPAPVGGGGGTGTGYGFQALIDFINSKGIDNTVTSTVRPGSITSNGNLSEHAGGWAADFAGDMAAITAAFNSIPAAMNELIHDPGGSIKRGQPVGSDFWGGVTWGQHGNHVHAATFHGPGDGPGVPRAGEGTGGGGGGGGGGGRQVGASEYGGPQDPSSGVYGYRGAYLPGTHAFAELSNPGTLDFSALGGLPEGAQLRISYNGNSVIGVKEDVGRGGGPVGGLPRAIDLWYQTADAIGFDGLGVVDIAPAAMGGLFSGGKMHTGVMDQGGWLMPGANLNWNGTGVPERISPPGAGGTTNTFHFGDIVAAPGTTAEQAESIFQQVRARLIRVGEDTPGGNALARR